MSLSVDKGDFEINRLIGCATHKPTGIVVFFNGNENKPHEVKVKIPDWLIPDTQMEEDKTAALLLEITRAAEKAFSEQ